MTENKCATDEEHAKKTHAKKSASMSTATTSPLALAQAFLADLTATENSPLPGNEELIRHLSKATIDAHSICAQDDVLRSLSQVLRLASLPIEKIKGRSTPSAQSSYLASVIQRQRVEMLAKVARVLVLDAMKAAQA
jgi:hypothetical protein